MTRYRRRPLGLGIAVIGLALACAAPPSTPSGPVGSVAPPRLSPLPSAIISPPAATLPAPSPTTAAGPGPWRSAPGSTVIAGSQFWHVVWTGRRFVATGSALAGSGTFIDSIDGSSWHRQTLPGSETYPFQIAAGPSGVVSVGRIGEAWASWFSPDGLTWTVRAAAFPRTVGDDEVSVNAVIATDDGWLAVGAAEPPCNTDCGLDPVRGLVWTSRDGLRWTRVADQASLADAGMQAVARGGPGYVAVGLAGHRGAAWTSGDGHSWVRVPDAPAFHGLPSADPSAWTELTDIAEGHGILVAIGHDGPGGAHGPAGRAWWSADGATWAEADGEGFAAVSDGSVLLRDVVATPEGFLTVAGSRDTCASGIWSSADGALWQCTALEPGLASLIASGTAASDSVEVVVGLDSTAEPGDDGFPGAVWLRSIP